MAKGCSGNSRYGQSQQTTPEQCLTTPTLYRQRQLQVPQIPAHRHQAQTGRRAYKDRLKGDIDSILIKALRKERAWRYASVEAFSEDIRRHLEGLSVSAHKDTLRYRGQKFLHRLVSPRSGVLHNNSIMFIGWGAFSFVVLIEKYLIAIGWKKNAGIPSAFYVISRSVQ